MKLQSSAFKDGHSIPRQFTADGRNLSPPLAWTSPPEGTRSLALLCEDPDAPRGTFTHWILLNIPPTCQEFGEGTIPHGAVAGHNDFGKTGYGGPAPPRGKPHHYHFKLFALNQELDESAGASRAHFLTAILDHVLDQADLVALYVRH